MFDDKLRKVEGLIKKVWDCGINVVIVHDVGIMRIVREVVDWRSGRGGGAMAPRRGLYGAPLEIQASM